MKDLSIKWIGLMGGSNDLTTCRWKKWKFKFCVRAARSSRQVRLALPVLGVSLLLLLWECLVVSAAFSIKQTSFFS